ncbi:TonB-dependent receptor [candidate division WOR-3 bacterium]|nr:TonB-dependent receptor [candidate division WOR-3 bacterium]
MNSLVFLFISFISFPISESEDIPHYWLPGIVVTAKRIQEPLSDVAVDMKVITEDEISRKGIRSVTELFGEEGFLDTRTTGIEGGLLTVGLRGFPADQLLVLLNGTVLNSPANGNFDFSEIPISIIKRIEIVKSPSSSLYGANASSGVINIITKEQSKEGISIEGNGNITGQGNRNIFSNIGYKKGKYKLNMYISERMSDEQRPNSEFNSFSGGGSISIHELITTKFSTGERKVGVPGPVPSPTYIPLYGDSNTYSLFDNQKTRYITGSTHIEKIIYDFTISSDLGYRRENLSFSQIYEGYNEDWSTYKANDNWYYITEQLTGSFQLSYRGISLGIDVIKHEFWAYDSLYDSDKDSLKSDNFWNPDRLTKGIRGNIKQKFFDDKIISTASVRWDKNSDYPDFLSYSGGLLFNVQNNLRIGTSFGKGFRSPTFNELYWPIYGNDSLKPEDSFQTNTYIDLGFRKIFFMRVSGFWREVKNSISWVDFKPQNIDRMIVKGIEINPTINPSDFLSLSLSFVLKKAEEQRMGNDTTQYWSINGNLINERRAPYIPEEKVTGSIELRRGENTFITFTSIYTGEKVAYFYDFVSSEYKTKKIDNVTLCNLGILQKLVGNFSLSLRVDNLFDKKYKSNFGYTLDDGDYPAPGRSVSIGLNFKGDFLTPENPVR